MRPRPARASKNSPRTGLTTAESTGTPSSGKAKGDGPAVAALDETARAVDRIEYPDAARAQPAHVFEAFLRKPAIVRARSLLAAPRAGGRWLCPLPSPRCRRLSARGRWGGSGSSRQGPPPPARFREADRNLGRGHHRKSSCMAVEDPLTPALSPRGEGAGCDPHTLALRVIRGVPSPLGERDRVRGLSLTMRSESSEITIAL